MLGCRKTSSSLTRCRRCLPWTPWPPPTRWPAERRRSTLPLRSVRCSTPSPTARSAHLLELYIRKHVNIFALERFSRLSGFLVFLCDTFKRQGRLWDCGLLFSGSGGAQDAVRIPHRACFCHWTQCEYPLCHPLTAAPSDCGVMNKPTLCFCSCHRDAIKPQCSSFATYVFDSALLCLQSYLNAFAFNNTVYTDLWDHLQQVCLLSREPSQPYVVLLFQTRRLPSGCGKHARCESSRHCAKHHEPLDSADGLPSRHRWHSYRDHHPKTLPVGSRVCGGSTVSVQVGVSCGFLLGRCNYEQYLCFILSINQQACYQGLTFSVLLSSYTWFVPIKWVKTGVEQQQHWLLKASGTVKATRLKLDILQLRHLYCTSLTRHQRPDESVRRGLGAAEHKHVWILQGELWPRQLGSTPFPAQRQPRGESRASSPGGRRFIIK